MCLVNKCNCKCYFIKISILNLIYTGQIFFRLLDRNYKTLQNRNVRQMGRFRSKLESFITSTLALTNTRAYNETCTVGIYNVVIVPPARLGS